MVFWFVQLTITSAGGQEPTTIGFALLQNSIQKHWSWIIVVNEKHVWFTEQYHASLFGKSFPVSISISPEQDQPWDAWKRLPIRRASEALALLKAILKSYHESRLRLCLVVFVFHCGLKKNTHTTSFILRFSVIPRHPQSAVWFCFVKSLLFSFCLLAKVPNRRSECALRTENFPPAEPSVGLSLMFELRAAKNKRISSTQLRYNDPDSSAINSLLPSTLPPHGRSWLYSIFHSRKIEPPHPRWFRLLNAFFCCSTTFVTSYTKSIWFIRHWIAPERSGWYRLPREHAKQQQQQQQKM